MSDIALAMDHVYKKFKKGEIYDSLRDLIPALTSKLFSQDRSSGCLEQREFWAVKDVSFQVKRGEAFGIIGANGAGKSTILKLLSRIMKPTKGTLEVNGTLSSLIEVGAGFHPDLTGRENIFLNGAILGMTRHEIENKFEKIVEFSGLAEFIDTPVKRYSSGMYARLGFSVASHVDPDILIVDEVLSVGDWAFQNKCMQKMTSVINGGATVIFVSHNLRAVISLCKRSMLLDQGKVVQLGPTEEVMACYMRQASDHERKARTDHDIYVSKVAIRNATKQSLQFSPGEKAFVDISISSKVKCQKLSLLVGLTDKNFYDVFNTGTDLLGCEPFSMEAGDTVEFTFEFSMHLAGGAYHLDVAVKRNDVDVIHDAYSSRATIFISSDSEKAFLGAANLYPRLVGVREMPH